MNTYRLSHVTRTLSVGEFNMVVRVIFHGRLAYPWSPWCPCGRHTYPGWQAKLVSRG